MKKSLFDYLGQPAGPELGKQVYAFAKKQKSHVDISSRYIKNRSYEGTVMLYPVPFLDKFFSLKEQAQQIKENKDLQFFL